MEKAFVGSFISEVFEAPVESSTTLKAAKLLHDAADILVSEGWCTRSVGGIGGPKCALGAINAALTDNTMTSFERSYGNHVWMFSVKALSESTGLSRRNFSHYGDKDSAFMIAHWNNKQTEADAVISKMREVADSLMKIEDWRKQCE